MIHLDTSFLIRALVPRSAADRALRGWILRGERIAISAIAWAEFCCGPLADDHERFARALLGEPLPFTAADATRAAECFGVTGRRRGTLADCMIAAVAMREGAALATMNEADFRRLERVGLVLANISP
jgi:predicted nucleic acid-binding protein